MNKADQEHYDEINNQAAIDEAEAWMREQGFGTDSDVPGMWSAADFTGGDPDERSYAQRERDGETGWRQRFILGVHGEHGDPGPPVGYDGFGAPLYEHQISPEGTE